MVLPGWEYILNLIHGVLTAEQELQFFQFLGYLIAPLNCGDIGIDAPRYIGVIPYNSYIGNTFRELAGIELSHGPGQPDILGINL